jgi:hypothetical protein
LPSIKEQIKQINQGKLAMEVKRFIQDHQLEVDEMYICFRKKDLFFEAKYAKTK